MHEQYAKILELSYCYNQKIWKIITKKAVILSYLEQHLKDYNQKAVILLYGFSHRHHAGRRLVIIYSYIMSCPFAPLRARAARRWSHRPSRTWWDARAEDTGTYVPSAIASPRACSWCTSYTAPKTATPPHNMWGAGRIDERGGHACVHARVPRATRDLAVFLQSNIVQWLIRRAARTCSPDWK